MDPASVGAAEHALGRARVADPALVVRRVDVLDALPRRQRGREHPLEQGRRHALSATGLLAHAQRGADRKRGEVRRRHAHPRHARVERTGAGRGHPAVVGNHEVGERGRDSGQARERAAGNATALPLVAGTGGDQRVDRGTVGVRAVVAVCGDRAVHEARVAREQRVVVDAELRGDAGREVLDDHVGVRCECRDTLAIRRIVGIEHRAALPAVPHLRAAERARRISARRLDLRDLRAVVGEQHACDRACDPGGEVQHHHAIEHTGHGDTSPFGEHVSIGVLMSPRTDTCSGLLMSVPPFGRRRDWRTPASGPRDHRGSTGT